MEMFDLKKHKADARTELLAALTTFFTMSYILVVNPRILSDAGLDFEAVFLATALSAALGSVIMGLIANKPLAMASGMGLNAYFTFTVMNGLGFPFGAALLAVFVSGLLMFALSFFGISISNAIPESFKHALIAGLGLFLVFIGLQNAHFVVTNQATIVSLGNLLSPGAIIAVFGFFITIFLVARNVNGALFIGVIATTVVAMLFGFSPPPDAIVSMPQGFENVFLKIDFQEFSDMGLIPVIWTLFIIMFFDNLGTNTALLTKAGHIDKKGRIIGLEKTLASNSIATALGAIIGAPTQVTYLESVTGIDSGGRTGLVAIGVGALFLASIFFFPLIRAVPIEAAAPSIVAVGVFMLISVRQIKFDDYTEALPALMTLAVIPFTFSISNGISVGAISYVFLKLVTGRLKEVHPFMYAITALSILEFAKIF